MSDVPSRALPAKAYRRRSARVLLVDGTDRILLFRFHSRRSAGFCWLTPGGGVNKQEPPREAAARELREETGLDIAPARLGPLVATTYGYADLGWASGMFRDDFYFHRTPAHEVDLSRLEDRERAQIIGYRWWTVDELTTTDEVIYPLRLVPLLAELIAGRIPAKPVRLPWHH